MNSGLLRKVTWGVTPARPGSVYIYPSNSGNKCIR